MQLKHVWGKQRLGQRSDQTGFPRWSITLLMSSHCGVTSDLDSSDTVLILILIPSAPLSLNPLSGDPGVKSGSWFWSGADVLHSAPTETGFIIGPISTDGGRCCQFLTKLLQLHPTGQADLSSAVCQKISLRRHLETADQHYNTVSVWVCVRNNWMIKINYIFRRKLFTFKGFLFMIIDTSKLVLSCLLNCKTKNANKIQTDQPFLF